MELTYADSHHLELFLEGFFYGLYSGIFAIYLQYSGSKSDKGTNKRDILFYAICALYVLSLATIVVDTTSLAIFMSVTVPPNVQYRLNVTAATIIGCCDFVSQSILIYRCWIVWGRNIGVVIIPLILSFTFLGVWLSSNGALRIVQGLVVASAQWIFTTSLTVTLTVNALVTGLIVFRILKVFWEVKVTLDEQTLGIAGGRKLRSVIFVLIESGMALFAIQLARLVATILGWPVNLGAGPDAVAIISGINKMLNGITPTIILVRVSMGLSFHDEISMVEVAGSLRKVHNDRDSVPSAIDSELV